MEMNKTFPAGCPAETILAMRGFREGKTAAWISLLLNVKLRTLCRQVISHPGMIPLIDRYLLQEIFKALLAIIVVLLLIFMGTTFIKLLQQVSVGDLNATLLFQMLGLEMFRFLARLVPRRFSLQCSMLSAGCIVTAKLQLWRPVGSAELACFGLF